MTQLMYQCPHCREQAEVPPEKLMQVNTCPACDRPYQPEVPVAKILTQRADGEWAVVGETHPGATPVGEKTIMTVHPAMFRTNPIKYSVTVLAFIIGVAGMIIFGGAIQNTGVEQWWRPITLSLGVVFGIIAVGSLVSLGLWLLQTRFESLTITNERTIWARGVFDRETSEVQHDDVRNIQMQQSLIDRILGVGRIAISSAGQDDMEIDIRGIPKPNQVADTVRSCQARMLDQGD
jgi:hypothetical protein